MQKKIQNQFKYFTALVMLTAVIGITAGDLIHDLININIFILNGGSFLTPLFFFCLDLITEVYGYKASKQVIWGYAVCTLAHAVLIIGILHIPSSLNHSSLPDYNWVFGSTLIVFIASTVGIIIGLFLNSFYLTKWKFLLKGKYFGLRSIGATVLGEFMQLLIVSFSILFLYGSKIILLKMLVSIYLLRVCFSFLLATPATFIAHFLKRAEGIDLNNYNQDFNPFEIKPNHT
jgi:uncharacterized integral membrane protein (TIGR00697 family)